MILSKEQLVSSYKLMQTSRALDAKMIVLLRQGKSFFHIGCMGHEAVQAAAALVLDRKRDWLFPYYRDQTLCLGFGLSAKDCLLGFLAKADDPSSGGRQMPQHYGHKDCSIPTSSSSTGMQYPQAVGAAIASMKEFKEKNGNKRVKDFDVQLVCSGDGTTSQGDFHEALSWACVDKAPVIFLIENNGYAISVPIKTQRPAGSVAALGKGYPGLETISVDGCNLEDSHKAFKKAVKRARSGQGPTLIDASVVRLLPHSSSDDQKKYRSESELKKDAKRDPVLALEKLILKKKFLTKVELEKIKIEIKKEVDSNAEEALKAKMPKISEATTHNYSSKKEPEFKTAKTDKKSKEIVLVDAINKALDEEMAKNKKVLVFGEDVGGNKGGVFTATRNLAAKHGDDRCYNSPLAESSIVGVAIGLALKGYKPAVEIQFGDYIWTAMMQIKNELATIRYRSNNNFSAPVVVRVPVGGYIHGGLCHSQNIEAIFSHIPGLKVAMPSNALDAYGLLKSAIRGDDPVLFLEHKALYRQNYAKSVLPKDKNWLMPFGKGFVKKEGNDLTIISYGAMVQKSLDAARVVKEKGIDVEVLDLCSIRPLDFELIRKSVKKTSRAIVVYEDNSFMGFGAEISAQIMEKCFNHLDAPVLRVAGKDTHIPFNWDLEEEVLPNADDIIDCINQTLRY